MRVQLYTIFLLFLLGLTFFGCTPGRLLVTPVSDTQLAAFSGGAYYALPMTMLTVEVPVTKIVRKSSQFYCDSVARVRLETSTDDSAKALSNQTFYKLGEPMTISSRPVPDPDKLFAINLTGNWRKSQSINLTLNELSLLTKADVVSEDHTFDIIVQGAKGIASIVAATGLLPRGAETSSTKSTSVVVTCPKAVSVISQLVKVRQDKLALLGGTATGQPQATEGTVRYRVAELDKLEQQLLDALTYTEEKTTYMIRRDVLINKPALDSKTIPAVPLFAFSAKAGLLLFKDEDAKSYTNEYVPYSFSVTSATAVNNTSATATQEISSTITMPYNSTTVSADVYRLVVNWPVGAQLGNTLRQVALPTNVVSVTGSTGQPESKTLSYDNGLVYNIPVVVPVIIMKGASTKATSNVVMPQLGVTSYLSRRSSQYTVDLDATTGSLRSVVIKQTGLTGDQIKAAGEAVSTAAALFKRDAPAAEPTALEKLQKERSLLEEQEKILKLQLSLDSLRLKQSNN